MTPSDGATKTREIHKSLWSMFLTLAVAAFGLSSSCVMSSDADGDSLANGVDSVADVLRLWEFDRNEYLQLLRVSPADRKELLQGLATAGGEKREALSLLLAFRCVNAAKAPFQFLYEYRCAGSSYSSFVARALHSVSDTYALAFVLDEHRTRTESFLKRYIEFWKAEGQRTDGVAFAIDDREYLSEILLFLSRGGYPDAIPES